EHGEWHAKSQHVVEIPAYNDGRDQLCCQEGSSFSELVVAMPPSLPILLGELAVVVGKAPSGCQLLHALAHIVAEHLLIMFDIKGNAHEKERHQGKQVACPFESHDARVATGDSQNREKTGPDLRPLIHQALFLNTQSGVIQLCQLEVPLSLLLGWRCFL